MKDLKDLKKSINSQEQLLDEFGVENIGIFGSYVRGDQKSSSDLDLLVKFEEKPTLFRLAKLERMLSDRLDLQVDLVTEDSLRKGVRDRVMEEVVYA